MTKLEIQAIRDLPEEYVQDGTCTSGLDQFIVAMATTLPPIIYKDGKWISLSSCDPHPSPAPPSSPV